MRGAIPTGRRSGRACVTKVGLGREAHEKPNKSGSSAVEKRGLAEKNYVEFRAKRTFVDVHIQSVAEIPNEFGKSHIHDAGPERQGKLTALRLCANICG